MTSLPIRDQADDHLLTPKNCTLIVIDYQPVQVLCELQRDWSRKETAGQFAEILFAVEGR